MTEELSATHEDPAEEEPAGAAAGGPGQFSAAAGGPGQFNAADPAAELGIAAERDRLARLLRETRLQLTMAQTRLAAVEQSATLELGRTLVRAARRPWPRGAQLPRDLYRMWRSGGAGQATPATSPAMLALASAQLSDLAGGGERLLSALTAPGLSAREPGPGTVPESPGLAVTGVLTARACAALAPDAAVHPLLPHDADILLEGCGADLVIIQAAALLASSPWAYAVDPAGADRGRRLGRLIAAARGLGKPVILVRDIPAHLAPGLDWVAASCDAVVDDDLGVPLAMFNPIGLPLLRDAEPMYAAAIADVGWRQLPGLYREHALFVGSSPAQAREQRACGARVVSVAGGEAAIAEAVAAGAPGWPEIVAALREIYISHATSGRLGALARLAGLPDGLVTGRQIAVLARADRPSAAQELGAGVLRQRLSPAELIVSVAPEQERRAVSAALSDVMGHGVRIEVVSHGGDDWMAACAARARSPWAVPWPAEGEQPDTYLLDLACARECSQADAVGLAGASYAYTGHLAAPGLARRELLIPGGPGGMASPRQNAGALDISQGLRLFSVS